MESQDSSMALFEKAIWDAKRTICRMIPRGVKYELYLIGSASRGEVTVLVSDEEIIPQSDIEFYLLTNMPHMEGLVAEINNELGKISFTSVEVNGTSYQRFNRYRVKQWLIDAAHSSRLMASSGIVQENAFLPFLKETLPAQDLVFLLLNRVVEYEREKDIYFLVKLYSDIAGVILYREDRYSVSVKRRIKCFTNVAFQQKVVESGCVSASFLESLIMILGYKLYPTKRIGGRIERDRLALESAALKVVKELINRLLATDYGIAQKSDLTESIKELYTHRGFVLACKEWFQDLRRSLWKSLSVLFEHGLRLSPRATVFFRAAQVVEESRCDNAMRLYNDWVLYCKSA